MVTIPVKNERAIFRFNATSDKRMSLIPYANHHVYIVSTTRNRASPLVIRA